MSIESNAKPLFEAIKSRHRAIQTSGVLFVLLGLLVSAFVAVEWFVHAVSHEVLAIVAAATILLGVQLLVLSTLTGMLIVLHQEQLHQFE